MSSLAPPPGDPETTADQRPILDIDPDRSHIDWSGERPVLVGSRCGVCGTACFPLRELCFTCGARDMAPASLADEGSLYSFSTVHVSSSRPVPYTIGYVDLDDGVRLLANIAGPADALRPDMRVKLVADDAGFAFAATGVAA